MKTSNTDLEHNSILSNHIFKRIILEAPTVPELERKIKEYKTLLIRTITNAYKLSSLTLENDGAYYILPTGGYQASIIMTYSGKKKSEILNPEKTLHYVKQLAALESRNKHKSNIILGLKKLANESMHSDTFVIEVNDESEKDEKISLKQKELLEGLIRNTNLTQISFFPTAKHKDPKTGKISITIKVNYKCRERPIIKTEHTDIEEENR